MLRLIATLSLFICALGSPYPKRHGLSDRDIIGGDYAKVDQFPYQLNLQLRNTHICGASLISLNVALTAAHCTYNENHKKLNVIAGSTDRHNGGKRIFVDRVDEHQRFKPKTNDYDIAILFLVESFVPGPRIRVIALPKFSEVIPPGSYATVSGWGGNQPTGDDSGAQTKFLKFVNIPIWKSKACLPYHKDLTSDVYCGGKDSGLENACAGDSGGPLVYKNKLFGIVIYGYGCGTPNKPVIYADVASYRNWISRKANI